MNFSARYFKALSILGCFFFAVVFAFPAALFWPNEAEFSAGFLGIIRPLILPSLLLLLMCAVLLASVPGRSFEFLTVMLIAVILLLYVQGYFMVREYGSFNGQSISWNKYASAGILDTVIWGAILLCAAAACRRISKVTGYITLFLVLAMGFSLAADILSNPSRLFTGKIARSTDTLYSFSPDRNIVWLILDSFSGPGFESILKNDPGVAEEFKAFTLFPDTVSPYLTTIPSVPALLTGFEYDNSESFEQFTRRAFAGATLPELMEKGGYSVDVVTMKRYCPYIGQACYPTGTVVSEDVREIERNELLELLDLTLFRILPQPLKQKVYNNQKWFLQRIFDNIGSPRTIYNAVRFPDIFENRASVDSQKPVFKVLHLMIPHVPIIFDADCGLVSEREDKTKRIGKRKLFEGQARCSLRLAARILARMKSLGVFDKTMIVISGDHGFPLRYLKYKPLKGEKNLYIEYSMPLLLIKPFNTSADNNLAVSEVEAGLMDVPETILRAAGVGGAFSGESLFELKAGPRERRHHSYAWRQGYGSKDFMPRMREWKILGNVKNPESWEFIRQLKPKRGE